MSDIGQLPAPEPTIDDREYWQAMKRHELVFRQCNDCSSFHHPPLPICPHCQSLDLAWTPARGSPELFTYTIVHHAAHPSMREKVPYMVVLVRFREMNDIRVVGNLDWSIVDGEPKIGEPLILDWMVRGDGLTLPLWKQAGQAIQ